MTQGAAVPGGQPKNEPLAIWALVCGILGLTCCPIIIPSIVAIVLAGKAKTKIEGSGGALGGETLAKVGGILGWVGIALNVIAIIVLVIVVMSGMTSMAGSGGPMIE